MRKRKKKKKEAGIDDLEPEGAEFQKGSCGWDLRNRASLGRRERSNTCELYYFVGQKIERRGRKGIQMERIYLSLKLRRTSFRPINSESAYGPYDCPFPISSPIALRVFAQHINHPVLPCRNILSVHRVAASPTLPSSATTFLVSLLTFHTTSTCHHSTPSVYGACSSTTWRPYR